MHKEVFIAPEPIEDWDTSCLSDEEMKFFSDHAGEINWANKQLNDFPTGTVAAQYAIYFFKLGREFEKIQHKVPKQDIYGEVPDFIG